MATLPGRRVTVQVTSLPGSQDLHRRQSEHRREAKGVKAKRRAASIETGAIQIFFASTKIPGPALLSCTGALCLTKKCCIGYRQERPKSCARRQKGLGSAGY
jgi:hypothetical protein